MRNQRRMIHIKPRQFAAATLERQMKPSIKKIKTERAANGGWANFKHWLVRQGVLSSVADDVPKEWQRAFLKANGRWAVMTPSEKARFN